jgi:hypothetical protein
MVDQIHEWADKSHLEAVQKSTHKCGNDIRRENNNSK